MNIQWQITPFVGMNELRFGLSRSQVRQMLASPYRPFRKGPDAFNETDSYGGLGFHLYYDRNDNLELIEAFSPCDVRFEGMVFLGRTLTEVLTKAKERNLTARVTEKSTSCYFDEQGIALYVENGEVTGTSIYPKGYYESSQNS